MNGRAPKLPLTGSQFEVRKNFQPKAWMESCESWISTQRISATMTKMLNAEISIRPPKVPSAARPELRSRRNRRISDGWAVSAGGGGPCGGVLPAGSTIGVGRVTGLGCVIGCPYEGRGGV